MLITGLPTASTPSASKRVNPSTKGKKHHKILASLQFVQSAIVSYVSVLQVISRFWKVLYIPLQLSIISKVWSLAANIPTINCSTCDVQRIAKVAVFLAGKVCAIVTISIPSTSGVAQSGSPQKRQLLWESGWMSAMRPRRKAGIVPKSMVKIGEVQLKYKSWDWISALQYESIVWSLEFHCVASSRETSQAETQRLHSWREIPFDAQE